MWSSSNRQINYGIPSEMGMLVVASASSFHHNNPSQEPAVCLDPHVINGSSSAVAATALGVGVIPLLTATPYLGPAAANMGVDDDAFNSSSRSRSSGIQLWQNQQTQHHPNYLKKPVVLDHAGAVNLLQSGGGGGGGGGIGGGSSSTSATTCQDCGNQAKKDCSHRRCRTCCKSRGFDCATHVKSTWVPAARRRERQLISAAGGVTAGSSGSTSGTKKPRLIASQTTTTSHTSTSNTTPPRSFDTSSSHQDGSFKEALPGQVRAPAVFKCVRVTAVDDGDDEYAYQAVVKIGGHVFKGFLYDQGVESRDGFPNISELHLGAGSSGVGGNSIGGRNGASLSSPILDPSEVYASTTGGLLGGSSYGNPIN